MEFNLKLVGVLLIVLALIHLVFPKYFKWKQELNSLSIINRQMMFVHTYFIAFVVLLMGFLCLTSSAELANTTFGKNISLGLGFFWGARLIVQFFGYSSKVWRGKRFETMVHILFSFLWTYLCIVFFWIYLS